MFNQKNPNVYLHTLKKENFEMFNSTSPDIHLRALNKEEVELIFRNKKAKYLSANDVNRHYIYTYNNDNTFTTDTYENNIKIGESYGTYKINVDGTININYKYVFSSPNKNSPFHPHNSFYNQLSNHTIGPFYTYSDINIQKNVIDGDILNIMYKGFQVNNYKNLTFYPKNSNIPNIHLRALNKEEVELIFRNKKEKYLSTNDINRHYIITYNNDNTFTTDTYENNIKIGESYGTYKINVDGTITINYKYIFSSPHKNSPFHPHNSSYTKLSNYNSGPYYIYSNIDIKKNIIDNDVLHIMYKGNQENNPSYLTFYPK